MSVAPGHKSQNYTNVNFVYYLQKNVENVGLVYKRSQSFAMTATTTLVFG